MSVADTSEKGLETLIMRYMTGGDGLAPVPEGLVAETPDALAAAVSQTAMTPTPRVRP